MTALVHLARGERRVVIDAIQLIAQIAKGVVLKLVDELTSAVVDGHRFMDVKSGPARRSAIIESRLEIRIEVRRSHPASEVVRDARHPVALAGRLGRQQGRNRRPGGEMLLPPREKSSNRSRPAVGNSFESRSRSRLGFPLAHLDGRFYRVVGLPSRQKISSARRTVDGVGDVFRLVEVIRYEISDPIFYGEGVIQRAKWCGIYPLKMSGAATARPFMVGGNGPAPPPPSGTSCTFEIDAMLERESPHSVLRACEVALLLKDEKLSMSRPDFALCLERLQRLPDARVLCTRAVWLNGPRLPDALLVTELLVLESRLPWGLQGVQTRLASAELCRRDPIFKTPSSSGCQPYQSLSTLATFSTGPRRCGIQGAGIPGS